MTDDAQIPTEADKAAAQAVLDDPDYLAEPDDPRDNETIDAPLGGTRMTLNPFALIGALLSTILPQAIVVRAQALIDQVMGLLQGEPAIVIGNGAAIVIYVVAKAFKVIPDQTFAEALAEAGAAFVLLNSILLAIRQYVVPAVEANTTAFVPVSTVTPTPTDPTPNA